MVRDPRFGPGTVLDWWCGLGRWVRPQQLTAWEGSLRGRPPSWPSRSLRSQETAFRADAEPLSGETLQLALIYDLTNSLRSHCPPHPILGSPISEKGAP